MQLCWQVTIFLVTKAGLSCAGRMLDIHSSVADVPLISGATSHARMSAWASGRLLASMPILRLSHSHLVYFLRMLPSAYSFTNLDTTVIAVYRPR